MSSESQFQVEFQLVEKELVRQRETDWMGEAWLQLHRVTALQAGGVKNIGNITNYVLAATRAQMRREDQPSGFLSFDATSDGLPLAETLAAPEAEDLGASRTQLAPEAVEELLKLHKQGTADLAKRLRCTRRNAQQKLKKRTEAMLAAVQGGAVGQAELWGGV